MWTNDNGFLADELESVAPVEALVVYESLGLGKRCRFAVRHEVTVDANGVPTLGAGRPMSARQIAGWASTWKRAAGKDPVFEGFARWIDARFLAYAPGRWIAWWRPPQPTEFFLEGGPRRGGVRARRLCAPWPGLVFVWRAPDTLHVAAVAESGRPGPDSAVFEAPFPNISAGGGVCMGSAPLPKRIDLEGVERVERAFVESSFTHMLGRGARIRSEDGRARPHGVGALWRLWRRLAEERAGSFPAERLVPMEDETLRSWLGRLYQG